MSAAQRLLTVGVGGVLILSAGLAPDARAQVLINEPPPAPIQFGPLYLTPEFGIRNIGVDSNVFNNESNQRDVTATVGTGLEAVLMMGAGRLTGTTQTDYVWFKDFPSERSTNNRITVGLEAFLTHVRPFGRLEYARTRERTGFEIDARARRTEPVITVGADVVVGSRTTLGLSVTRRKTEFGEGETFQDVNLGEALNNTVDAFTVDYRMALTPLTTLVINTELQRDRFDAASIRNADSYRIVPRLEFDPDALVSGEMEFGFRSFQPRSGVPGFKGLVGRALLSYTLFQRTQFAVDFTRDTGYSFELGEPYYLQTGGTLTITQRVAGPWDILGTAGRQRLQYRQAEGVDTGRRLDEVTRYGGGVGFRLGDTVRIGFTIEHFSRRSTRKADRGYDRTHSFMSVTYVL